MKSFTELPLTDPILKSLERMKYETPTDVQVRTIPLVLEGRDVLVTAQTGTGKTAAFAVPILQRMIAALDADEPVKRTLILAPTRELAEQILTVIRDLTFFFRRIRSAVIIGGAPYGKQFRELGMDPAFVVGTPGRLIDHIETKTLKLDDFDVLVLDESDRMLDMGFAPQIDMIVRSFPPARQTMMFSATLPPEVRGLVAKYLKNPSRVAIGEENRPVAAIQQDVVEVREGDKTTRLIHELDGMAGTIIVFTKTRLKADVVAEMLTEAGHVAEALHGDLNQGARRKVTARFRTGATRILVATDIASRGLDIDHVRHVINYDLPMVPEDYIHRIGRTGRAGKEGHSVAFVTQNERGRWNQILRLMGLPSQGGGGRGGSRSYKGAATRSAFSGGPGNARAKPFATPYLGETPAKFVKPKSKNSRNENRPVAPTDRTGRTPSRAERREEKPYKLGRKSDRPATAGAARVSRDDGNGSPRAGDRGDGYHSPKAKSIREEFQSRAEYAEKNRADRLGRKPRFTAEQNARQSGNPVKQSEFTATGAKPHKGKPDTRKRKSIARNATKPWAGPPSGANGGDKPQRRSR